MSSFNEDKLAQGGSAEEQTRPGGGVPYEGSLTPRTTFFEDYPDTANAPPGLKNLIDACSKLRSCLEYKSAQGSSADVWPTPGNDPQPSEQLFIDDAASVLKCGGAVNEFSDTRCQSTNTIWTIPPSAVLDLDRLISDSLPTFQPFTAPNPSLIDPIATERRYQSSVAQQNFARRRMFKLSKLFEHPSPVPTSIAQPPRGSEDNQIGRSNVNVSETSAASSEAEGSDGQRTSRKRLSTQVHQSPITELNGIPGMSKNQDPAYKAPEDDLIVFYRNEFLAVRNEEEGFYVCKTMQDADKSVPWIRIKWFTQIEKTDYYYPDYFDNIEFETILTNVKLERVGKNKYRLRDKDLQRVQIILKRSIDIEKGNAPPEITEEHPDGHAKLKNLGMDIDASSTSGAGGSNEPDIDAPSTSGAGGSNELNIDAPSTSGDGGSNEPDIGSPITSGCGGGAGEGPSKEA